MLRRDMHIYFARTWKTVCRLRQFLLLCLRNKPKRQEETRSDRKTIIDKKNPHKILICFTQTRASPIQFVSQYQKYIKYHSYSIWEIFLSFGWYHEEQPIGYEQVYANQPMIDRMVGECNPFQCIFNVVRYGTASNVWSSKQDCMTPLRGTTGWEIDLPICM